MDQKTLSTVVKLNSEAKMKLRLNAMASGKNQSEYLRDVLNAHFSGSSMRVPLSNDAMSAISKEVKG